MIAVLPPWVEDLMSLWPLWGAIGTIILAWGSWSLKTWLKVNVADPISKLSGEVTATQHLVSYHLGPNSDSPRMHERVHGMEVALGINATAPERDIP